METLAVETLSVILAFACYDDQKTASSLELTCKWIYPLIKPVRFEALSLHGLRQIMDFDERLQQVQCDSKSPCSKTRHLFMSWIPISTAERRRTQDEENLRKLAIALGLRQARPGEILTPPELDDKETFEEDCERREGQLIQERRTRPPGGHHPSFQAFARVLRTLAPSIETLFLFALPPSCTVLPGIPFPNLARLSTAGCTVAFYIPQQLPSLKFFHTTINPVVGPTRDPASMRALLPSLKHLIITNMIEWQKTIVYDIKDHARFISSTGAETHNEDETLELAKFPDSLKRVVLQQTSPPYGAICGNGYIGHKEFNEILYQAKAEMSATRGGFIVETPNMPSAKQWADGKIQALYYNFFLAREDYSDVISGGDGIWSEGRQSYQ